MRPNAIRLMMAFSLLVAATHSAVCAVPDNWSRGFTTGCNVQTAKNMMGLFGVSPLASDEYDSSDRQIPAGYDLYIGTFHDGANEQAWSGPTGLWDTDFRTPISPGRSKTWTFYVWAAPSLSADASYIVLDFGYNAGVPEYTAFSLTLKAKPSGVAGGPAVGTVWDLSRQPYGVQLPVFRTANGLEGYAFDFTATVVPEPSTFLALFTGIGGIGGLMWRRRAELERKN